MPDRPLTKTQKRLLRLFKDIEDEDIQNIIIDVVSLESSNRSSHSFPIRKVRDVIDGVARKQEAEGEMRG